VEPVLGFDVPSGLVWPPIEGRIFLREALQGGVQTTLLAEGDQVVLLGNGHRACSPREATFGELERGRGALIAWARKHASAQALLSKGRCLILSPGPHGTYRLWQVLRTEPTLRDLFIDGCDSLTPRHAARQLANASRLLVEAQASCRGQDLSWPCTLDTIGISEAGAAVYVGGVPLGASPDRAVSGAEQVAHELAAVLRHRSAADRVALCRELLSFHGRDPRVAESGHLEALLSRLNLHEPWEAT
jgi:hypothetical protein